MVKIIQLYYMRNGYTLIDGNNKPLESIDKQVKNILKENPNYTYVGLINEHSEYVNMENAALVVEII